MDDLIGEFLTETNESIAALDNDLVELEQNPDDTELLSGIFRLMHTIKGTCGFLGLSRLEKVAHKAEDVLGRFREGELKVTSEYMTLIFESLDRIKYIINEIETTGAEPEGSDDELIRKLAAVYEGKLADQDAQVQEGTPPGAAAQEKAEDGAPNTDQSHEKSGVELGVEPEKNEKEEMSAEITTDIEEEPAHPSPAVPEHSGTAPGGEVGDSAPGPDEKKAATPPSAAKAVDDMTARDNKKEGSIAAQTLRVNVDVLEDLMTMVSELVLTRNQLMQIMRNQRENEFSTPLQNLNQVVSELQDGVMKTRMQPIGNAWAKLPRIIRDITMELGKKIELEMRGKETELDRQVLEMIKDPLTHMVRNSADHGIESPAERIAAGKPETGRIILNAYHEGGHIIIEIKDDGKGLPIDKIKQKVLDKGLATQEELENMSDHQIQQFIFNAGFSTAEKVTSVSGRGVGMDVVRSNIENIGGSIELNSEQGQGTTFFIKIPLTLAIVSSLIVEAGGERFAIPQLAVRELVMATEQGKSRIELIKGTPVFRLRNHLLPLVSLKELLKIDETPAHRSGDKDDPDEALSTVSGNAGSVADNVSSFADGRQRLKAQAEGQEAGQEKEVPADHIKKAPDGKALKQESASLSSSAADRGRIDGEIGNKEGKIINLTEQLARNKARSEYIVVTQVGSYQFGIIVDQVYDTEEIVVKPVSRLLRDIDLFSGNTILGDGSVIMILDPAGIANTTGDIKNADKTAAQELKRLSEQSKSQKAKIPLLLFHAGGTTPKAVPLGLVARLENIKIEDIEYADDQMLIQYRERLMPLIPLNQRVEMDKKEKPVLVFTTEDKAMGLVVDHIVDILEAKLDVQYSAGRQGIMGSAIINGKATDLIDVSYYLELSDQEWFKADGKKGTLEKETEANRNRKRRVLLVDDSPFFRNMMAPLLSVAGYEVTERESAVQALALLEKGEKFDVIVSDIEMPDMSGFEFAEKVRSHKTLKNTPLVALSAHATSADMSRGEEAGFHRYVAKFDRENLITTLNETLENHPDAGDGDAESLPPEENVG